MVRKIDRLEFADFAQSIEGFKKESDRAAAILSAAFLEAYLVVYLRVFFVDEPECATLFDETAPLGTFAARAQVAYAFGLLTPGVARDLRYIRKIRNLFAHDITDLSFSSPQVKDLCSNLSTAKAPPNGGVGVVSADPREQYLSAFTASVQFLWNRRLARERQQASLESTDAPDAS
jgi:DNA-binding MltR family transcriptional regulator